MIVCQCKAVSDRQVNAAVAEGCSSVRSVAALTGAGTGCGGCVPSLRDLVCGGCPSRVTELACDDMAVLADTMADPTALPAAAPATVLSTAASPATV